jgi:hypothetical protein
MLKQVLSRAAKVPMSTSLAAETIRALVVLPRPDDPAVLHTFVTLARRDAAAVSEAVKKLKIDAAAADHGRRLAVLCRTLSVARGTDEVVWQQLQESLHAGLAAGAWRPLDVRDALRGVARWGTYRRDTLPAAADRYAAMKAPYAEAGPLGDLALGLTALPESKEATALHAISQRLVLIADKAPGSTFGAVCKSFVRTRFKDPALLAVVLQQLPRITPQLRGTDATAVLAWWALHDYNSLATLLEVPPDTTGAGRRAAAAALDSNAAIAAVQDKFNALLKTAVAEMPDDVDGIVSLLRCLTALSEEQWIAVSAAVDEALEAAAVMSQELLAAGEKSIGVEDLTALMPRFFRAVRDRPGRLMPHEAAVSTMAAFADHAATRAEELVAHESSPYFIVTCLLGAPGDPPPKECRRAATEILLEAKAQEAALPTLQTFRYILSYGDHKDFDRRILGYLRRNFASTLEGIPLVQLCTGLRCFAVAALDGTAAGEGALSEAEQTKETQELHDFINDVAVALERRNFAYDMRLLLALCALPCDPRSAGYPCDRRDPRAPDGAPRPPLCRRAGPQSIPTGRVRSGAGFHRANGRGKGRTAGVGPPVLDGRGGLWSGDQRAGGKAFRVDEGQRPVEHHPATHARRAEARRDSEGRGECAARRREGAREAGRPVREAAAGGPSRQRAADLRAVRRARHQTG